MVVGQRCVQATTTLPDPKSAHIGFPKGAKPSSETGADAGIPLNSAP